MKSLYVLVALAFIASSFAETVIFYDDFKKFDLSVWQHEITAGGGGNWEFEYYLNNRSNSYVRDGVLYLKPTLTADTYGQAFLNNGILDLWGAQPADQCTGGAFYGCWRQGGAGGNIINPIQSARIRTAKSFSFQYGKVEIRAKLPRGDWLWPAMWMLPKYESYGLWPASGEIDIVESRGNDPSYAAGGCNVFGSTLHWGPFFGQDPFTLTHNTYQLPKGTFNDDFHVFTLIWNSTNIMTYVDDPSNIVLNVQINQPFWEKGGWSSNPNLNNPWAGGNQDAPFDQEFYLLFNVAVGGTNPYFPDGMGGKPWANASPNAVNQFWGAVNQWYPTWNGEGAALQIDYVKVTQD